MAEDEKTETEGEKTEVKPGTAETPVTPATPARGDVETGGAEHGDDAAPTEGSTPAEPPAEGAERLTLAEAQGWKGFKLDDLGGATAGRVEGVYVDEESGEPEWLLARMGRFGHHCLIPARDAVGAAGHVWVPYSRDQIRKAPRMDPGQPLEQQTELALLEHYGVGTNAAGRGAALAKREASAVTARPAQ